MFEGVQGKSASLQSAERYNFYAGGDVQRAGGRNLQRHSHHKGRRPAFSVLNPVLSP